MDEKTERPTDWPKVTQPGSDKAVSPGLQNQVQHSVHHPRPPTLPSATKQSLHSRETAEAKGCQSKRPGRGKGFKWFASMYSSLSASESPGVLVKTQIAGPHPQSFWLRGLLRRAWEFVFLTCLQVIVRLLVHNPKLTLRITDILMYTQKHPYSGKPYPFWQIPSSSKTRFL